MALIVIRWTEQGRTERRRAFDSEDEVLAEYRTLQLIYFKMAELHIIDDVLTTEMFVLRSWLNENYPGWRERRRPTSKLEPVVLSMKRNDGPLRSANLEEPISGGLKAIQSFLAGERAEP